MWTAVEDPDDQPGISGSGGLSPQIFITDQATLDLFNVTMKFAGALIGDDIDPRGTTTADPYKITMHEVELFQSATNGPGYFRVRPNALTSDSTIQSLRLNGLEQGMYLYDPTSETWGDALDNLQLTVLRGGVIMDGGSAPKIVTLRDFDETANLARATNNADSVYSIAVSTQSGGDLEDISAAVIINNARGMECGAHPRLGGNISAEQRRGSVITVKETSFFVRDEAGNGIDRATVYIPSEHGTSITTSLNDVITFNTTLSQTLLSGTDYVPCLLYTSPSPRDRQKSRMPSSA